MEHFDEDVHERLKINVVGTREKLDRIGRLFWAVTKHALIHNADFDDKALAFDLNKAPIAEIQRGRYHLISKKQENIRTYLYRLSHPLGEHVLTESRNYLSDIKGCFRYQRPWHADRACEKTKKSAVGG